MKDAVVVLYDSKEFKKLDKSLKGKLTKAVKTEDALEKNSFIVDVNYVSDEFPYISVAKSSANTAQEWRDFGGNMFKKYYGIAKNVVFQIDNPHNENIYEGFKLASYNFTKYKSNDETKSLDVCIDVDTRNDAVLNDSVSIARDFVTEPGNVLYPAEYARRIDDLLTPLGVNVRILHQSQLELYGFDLLLSVGQGSTKDSYVVVMEYLEGDINEKPIALVGKGVTFDTGGISIKPSAGMGDMKFDMGGSAAVVGAMHAIASKNLGRNVVGIVGLVENMPDGNSIKPGDVVKSLSGKTVENLNTDAEGRLVLADILTYVQREYDPGTIIDLATLTGAILVSLGNDIAGLFTNSSELSNTIEATGYHSGEKFWRMPMGKDWNKMLDSDIADMKNIGGGRYGGSTTAAEFLYRFVDSHRAWAHLDIAGTVWSESGKPTSPKGAVGFGVRTLFNFVKDESNRVFEIDEDMDY